MGKSIAYLRKRAGYTQRDLADRIGISDKAVSKWERGLGTPDIAYFGKLAILLDTDTDSLLSGEVIHHEKDWSGLLLLPENAEGFDLGTQIYNKPMVYFLLSYFLLVGIKNIYIGCGKVDEQYIKSKFGDGSVLGIKLFYRNFGKTDLIHEMNKEEQYQNIMVVFGRSFIYGVDQTRFFQRAMLHRDRITILSLPKKIELKKKTNSSLRFDEEGKIVAFDSQEKIRTQYDYYEIPVLFCPKEKLMQLIIPKEDNHFSINLEAFRENELYTETLDRGFVEMKMDTAAEILNVSLLIKLIQEACGMEIYCLEEIAWRRGMITLDDLKRFGQKKSDTEYGRYILDLTKEYEF